MKRIYIYILHLFTLNAFACAPLFDLLSRYPQYLVAHESKSEDVVLLLFILFLLLPIILILIYFLTNLISSRINDAYHKLILFSIFLSISLPITKKLESLKIAAVNHLSLILSLFIAFLISYLYFNKKNIRVLISLASPAIILFPMLFFFNPAITKIVFVKENIANNETIKQENLELPTIVMVIFDELPISSLLNKDKIIDDEHFPNFSYLANRSFWYRRATTVSAETIYSVPSILTGNYPKANLIPTLSEYPYNIFTNLQNYYDLYVSENCTSLCPSEKSKIVSQSKLDRFINLVLDSVTVYLHVISPVEAEKKLPPINLTWEDFRHQNGQKINKLSKKHRGKHARNEIFYSFIDALKRQETKTLNLIHINFPHFPWIFYPSGNMYGNFGTGTGGLNGLNQQWWSENEWLTVQAYQRHLLQVEYCDKMLGDLINKLKTEKMFESCLFILTADHGVSFRKNDHLRSITETNYNDIMFVPLMLKLPNQNVGKIDDKNAQTIDILPTIADILNLKLRAKTDGSSLFEEDTKERKEKIVFNGPWINGELNKKYVFEDQKCDYDDALKRKLKHFGLDFYRIGDFNEIIGKTINEVMDKRESSNLKIKLDYAAFLNENKLESFLIKYGNLSGTITNREKSPNYLAVALNGIIAAVTKSYVSLDNKEHFSALLNDSMFRKESNNIKIFEIEKKENITLREISDKTDGAIYRIDKEQNNEYITICDEDSNAENKIIIDPNAMMGRLDRIDLFEGGQLSLYGWAADVINSKLPKNVMVFVNDRALLNIGTEINRPGIAASNKVPENCGFVFTIPINEFNKKDSDELTVRIFAVSDQNIASEVNYPYGYSYSNNFKEKYTMDDKGNLLSPSGNIMKFAKQSIKGNLDVAVEKSGKILFSGWAADLKEKCNPEGVLVFIDSKFVFSDKMSHYIDNMPKGLGMVAHKKYGFIFEIPRAKIRNNSKVKIIAINQNGTAAEIDYFQGYKWK